MLVSVNNPKYWSNNANSYSGDMAYDMNEDNARVGDDYMNAIQSIAAYIPYMTCPGNHENA